MRYETTRAKDYDGFVLIFDSESGESWPRLRNDETYTQPGVVEKWRERYRRLRAENPDLPTPGRLRENS